MTTDSPQIAYAKEVYAACATVGFTSETVMRLKRLIDVRDVDERDLAEIVAVAQAAQRESIDWAGRPER